MINSVVTTAIAAPKEPNMNIKLINITKCSNPANITIFEKYFS